MKQVEEKLQEKMAEIPRIVQQQVGQALNNMMPSMFEYMRGWLASGQQGCPPIPSFTCGNSHNALVSPAAAAVSPVAAALVSPAADALVSPAAAALVTSAADAFVTLTAARALERRTPDTSGQAPPPSHARPPLAVHRH